MNSFSIHSYASLLDTEGKWRAIGSEEMYQLINFLINSGMTVNRWIYQIVDLSLQLLLSNTVFEDTVGRVFKTAITLYHSLFDTLGAVLFLIALVIIFFIYVFKSPQESFKKMLVLFAIIGMNFVIYTNGEGYLKDINLIFDEAETLMLQGVTLPSGEQGQSENIGSEKSMQKIRDAYFDMTVRQAFAMINFGTPIYEERFDLFLYTDEQENNERAKEELLIKVKEEGKENRYMTPDGSLDKWFLSVYAWVNNLFVGVPLLLMAALKFLLKILILCVIFGLPPVSLLSLLPKFSNVLFNLLGKMMLFFFIGMFMSLVVYIFFFLMTLIDGSIIAMAGNSSLISSMLGTVNKATLILLLLKGKGKIISVITAGAITQIETATYKHRKQLFNQEKKSDSSLSAVHSFFENKDEHEKRATDFDFRDILVMSEQQGTKWKETETKIRNDAPKISPNRSYLDLKMKDETSLEIRDNVIQKLDNTIEEQITERQQASNRNYYRVVKPQEQNEISDRNSTEEVSSQKIRIASLDESVERHSYEMEELEEKKSFYKLLEELRTC